MPLPPALILPHPAISNILHSLPRAALLSIISTLSTTLQHLSSAPAPAPVPAPAPEREIHQPLRQSITTNKGYTTLFMPSANASLVGVKSVTLPPADSSSASPAGSLTVFALDGVLLGVLDAAEMTAFRTAAVSLIVPLALAGARGRALARVVVFGTGRQAAWVLELLQRVVEGGFERVTVVTRASAARAGELVRGFGCVGEVLVVRECEGQEELAAVVGGADAIFCCTPATEPLFDEGMLTRGKVRYVSLIGSYRPDMKEVDPVILRRDGVVVIVDSAEACLVEAGEIIQAGLGGRDLVEIGQAVREIDAGLEDKYMGDIIFKCVGLAIMDLVVGAQVLDIAREMGIGVEISCFSSQESRDGIS